MFYHVPIHGATVLEKTHLTEDEQRAAEAIGISLVYLSWLELATAQCKKKKKKKPSPTQKTNEYGEARLNVGPSRTGAVKTEVDQGQETQRKKSLFLSSY